LPGIPLAIVFSHIPVTLIERMGRRANFLRNTAAVLRLSNVEIIEKPMEEAPPKRFDAVCFRAFRPLDAAILQNLRRLLKPGGFLAAYKGRLDRVQADMAGVKTIGPSWEAIHCPVPFLNDERRLLIIG
jgi:16S rRNA (guanine527-N7)-methyltransferase